MNKRYAFQKWLKSIFTAMFLTMGAGGIFVQAAHGAPDLVPISMTRLTPDELIVNGATVTLAVTIRNDGDSPTVGGRVHFYYSTHFNELEHEFTYAFRGVPDLMPGESKTVMTDIRMEGLQAGDTYFVTQLEGFGEENTANNIYSNLFSYGDTHPPSFPYFDFRYASNGIYKTGQKYSFVYTVQDDIGTRGVDLAFSLDNGQTWEPIATAVPVTNSGYGNSYDWVIPVDTLTSNTFQVRIIGTDTSGNVSPVSANILGPFSLVDGTAPAASVSAPAAGAIWDLNSTQTIRWSASSPNNIKQVELRYVYGNGYSTEPIATLTGNPGSYTWKLPSYAHFASETAQIRLIVTDMNLNQATINSPFFTTRDASAKPPAPWAEPARVTTVPAITTPYTTQNNTAPTIAMDAAEIPTLPMYTLKIH